jgi:hypothetical protein
MCFLAHLYNIEEITRSQDLEGVLGGCFLNIRRKPLKIEYLMKCCHVITLSILDLTFHALDVY